MTLNVLGSQATVSGTVSVAGGGMATGEITVLTTAATADYVALVTLTLSAVSSGATFSGGFTLPGTGGGVAVAANGGTQYLSNCDGAGAAVIGMVSSGTPAGYGASAVIKVGPSTPIKVPYSFASYNTGGTVSYTINGHVAYVRNP